MDPDTFTHLREVGIGIVSLLMLVLTIGLTHYIYTHRIVLTVADREARSAAIGLCLFFGALAFRTLEGWATQVATRLGWTTIEPLHSPTVYIIILVLVLIGALLTLRAFHKWPLWLFFMVTCVSIPIIVSFL